MKDIYESYYTQQAGSGLPVFIGGNRYQRGYGLGNILGGLARVVSPLLRQTGKTLLNEGLKTGVDVLGDVISGQKFGSSIKKRGKEAGSRLLTKAIDSVNSRGLIDTPAHDTRSIQDDAQLQPLASSTS